MEERTTVLFRMWKPPGEKRYDTLIALFPLELFSTENGIDYCASYQHIGQHGAASLVHIIDNSRPAFPEEYKSLHKELESLGYKLWVVYRKPAWTQIKKAYDEQRKCSFENKKEEKK